MKKLIIAAAAIMVGIAANAATTTWSVLNIKASNPGVTPAVAGATGWLVQIYSSDVTYSYEAAKEGTIKAADSATTYASGSIIKAGKSFGDFAANEKVSLYAVIYDAAKVSDANHYIVSAVKSVTVGEGGGDITHAFGNFATTVTSNMFANSTWQSVPEPTSGLLLLLGVAGLALRRKQK